MSASTARAGEPGVAAPVPRRGRASSARSRFGAPLAIAGPAALGLALSLIALPSRSLGFDEATTAAIAQQSGHALWRSIARDGGNMSGYYLLLHALVGWFGAGPWVLRLPSAVFAAVTAGAVATLGRRLFDRRVGATAGVLTAASLPLVYWGQTARAYSPMLALACAGMVAFVALARRAPQPGPAWRRPAAAYVALTVLAAYASFVAVLIVVAQLTAIAPALAADRAARVRAGRRVATALAGIVVCCLPLAVLAARRGSGQLFWLPRPSHEVEEQVAQSLTATGLTPSFPRVVTTTPGWILTALAVIALIGLLTRGRFADRSLTLVLAWAVLPGLLTFLYSLLAAQPIFLSRNLLVSVPAVALALAAGAWHRRVPGWACAAALTIALGVRIVALVDAYGVSPEPWNAATAAVLEHARAGDCIAFYPLDARNAFRYYAARDGALARAPRSILPAVGWDSTRPYVELYASRSAARLGAARRGGCARTWLVSSHEGQADGPALSRRHRARWYALRGRLRAAYGPRSAGPSARLGYASPVHVQLFAPAR